MNTRIATLPSPSFSRSPPTNQGKGYFAFPPTGPSSLPPTTFFASSTNNYTTSSESRPADRESEPTSPSDKDQKKEAYEKRLQRDTERHAARLALEQAEAIRGEEEWVRSGGILRDSEGRRDVARTEAIREELRLRDVEKGLRERWERYEVGWKELMRRVGSAGKATERDIQFADIPWPVSLPDDKKDRKGKGKGRDIDVSDITPGRVEEFLVGPLKIRGCEVTRKERIRSSLLRWHPDKLTALVGRVVESDVENVENGVGAVVRCLGALKH